MTTDKRDSMYFAAINIVISALGTLVPEMLPQIQAALVKLNTSILRDCRNLITPPTAAQIQSRKQISDFIEDTKEQLRKIIDSGPVQEDEQQ